MKKFISTLLITAIGGSFSMGLDATNAQVTFAKTSTLEFQQIAFPTGGPSFVKKAKKVRIKTPLRWNILSIPVKVEGKCKGGKTPDFVPALEFKVSLLIDQGRGEKPALLKKTLKYVNIPVGSNNIGVLLSPSDTSKMTSKDGEAGNGDMSNKVVGIAVEASFEGENCMKTGEPFAYIFDPTMEKKLSSTWWNSSIGAKGGTLYGINETPFAAFYDSHFPQMNPIFSSEVIKPTSGNSSRTTRTTED